MWYTTAFSFSQCFVFSCQVVKLLALNLLSIFFPFYVKNRKNIFPSGWKFGTHMNAFPVSEQLEEQSPFKPAFNVVTHWLALMTRASCWKHGIKWWVLWRKGVLPNLLLEFTLARSANENDLWSKKLLKCLLTAIWFFLYCL